MAWEGPTKGRVIDHAPRVDLLNAKFVVRPAGRARVIREKRKNVHAFVEGDMVHYSLLDNYSRVGKIEYNPYRSGSFRLRIGRATLGEPNKPPGYVPVKGFDGVILSEHGISGWKKP